MSYHIEVASEQGPVRSNNEDRVDWGHVERIELTWMVIADGMGGHAAGEIASDLLVSCLKNSLENLRQVPLQGWQAWCREEILLANQVIFQAATNNPDYQGMGTTGVVALLHQQQCHVAWVGDSRAYLFRNSEISQLTEDHTLLQELINQGAISLHEANACNIRHILSRAIGVKERVEVDSLSINLEADDVILLSTDGLHDQMVNAMLAGYLTKYSLNEDVCHAMITAAIQLGSRDNISLGIIHNQSIHNKPVHDKPIHNKPAS